MSHALYVQAGSPMGNLSFEEEAAWFVAEYVKLRETIDIIEKLRKNEGASVLITCDNPESNGEDIVAIEVTDDWTGDEPLSVYGPNLLIALRKILLLRDKGLMT